jgi:predicted signal transduction protein with EAL and GGDEF domain
MARPSTATSQPVDRERGPGSRQLQLKLRAKISLPFTWQYRFAAMSPRTGGKGIGWRDMIRSMRPYLTNAIILLGVVLAQAAAIAFDIFDNFYDFTRAHENWELDELATLLAVAAVGFGVALVVRTAELRRALTDRDRAEKEALSMSRLDPLTGLPNRRGLQIHFDGVVTTHSSDLALGFITLLIDLDRFKQVNDVHGHDFGDTVLKCAAERLM